MGGGDALAAGGASLRPAAEGAVVSAAQWPPGRAALGQAVFGQSDCKELLAEAALLHFSGAISTEQSCMD